MPAITAAQGEEIERCVVEFRDGFRARFVSILEYKIHYFTETQEIATVFAHIKRLRECLQTPADGTKELPDELLPCLKRVVITIRREKATRYENAKESTIHPELISYLEAKVKPLDELLEQTWLRKVEPMKIPKLTEYLSVQQIEEHWHGHRDETPREYDEKFRVLQAPRQFLPDLERFRWTCELRGIPVVVAHIDIDDFKRLNSMYGHVEVDRRVLPPFMRLVEAHVFSHGYAYRYGGDEYALLLPNFEYDMAAKFLNLFRKKVGRLQYQGISDNTTVSIGFYCLDPDSYLTNREAEERANKAMNFAKKQSGKNCVASYLKAQFNDESLRVVR